MKAWRFFASMIRFLPWYYSLNTLSITLVFLFEMIPGLVARDFFDRYNLCPQKLLSVIGSHSAKVI